MYIYIYTYIYTYIYIYIYIYIQYINIDILFQIIKLFFLIKKLKIKIKHFIELVLPRICFFAMKYYSF